MPSKRSLAPSTPKLSLQLGEIIPYGQTESAQSAPNRRQYHARFVRAGRVRAMDNQPSHIVIDPLALESAVEAGRFENKAVFVDHAGFFDYPSLDNLAGVTHDSHFDHQEQCVLGTITLNDSPSGRLVATLLDEFLANPGHQPDIGLSIVFYPVWERQAESDDRIIRRISHVESVDLVFAPAADGRILQALSSMFVTNPFNPLHQSVDTSPNSERNPSMTVPTNPVQQQADDWLGELARSVTAQVLRASGLPQASQERLSTVQYETSQALEAAIEKERLYLASLTQEGVVQIGNVAPRSPQITGMRSSLDRIQSALEALLAGTRPPDGIQPLTGIRELYHLLSGDYEMTGIFQGERIQFANVNSSTMAGMVANALNKRLAAEFQEYDHWWNPIVLEEDFQTLHNIKWISLGGVGELPTVSEGATYTELTWDDSSESGTFVKKGGYLGLTLEAIDKDETGRLRGAPRALAQAAWLTLSKAVSYIFTQSSGVGPTMSDTYALFEAAHHANLGTSALSMSTYNAARTAMRKQTELNSGERLGALTAPKFLLVPPDLEITALQILGSEYDYTYALSNGTAAPSNANTQGNDYNARMAYARSRVIVVDLWTDTNDWAAVCDPRMYPTIGIGYRYGRTPEIFSVASPTAGLMFSNDTMPVKVRFFFAVAPIDYRGMYKANVT